MTIGSRTVPDQDIASIRLVPVFSDQGNQKCGTNCLGWRVEAVQRTGPPLVCATGDHGAMLDVLLWAGKAWIETPRH